MGDKSPKSVNKHAAQKLKATAAQKKKSSSAAAAAKPKK
jgi:hypothetical protein